MLVMHIRDFSKEDVYKRQLPALLAAYAMGPVSGIAVCFIKNAINLLHTQTGGVGELSNFILGVCFVLPAGLIYKRKKTQKSAMIGALAGAVLMLSLIHI